VISATLPIESADVADCQSSLVAAFLRGSPVHMEVLRVATEVDGRLWLGGGAIRSLVWDALTGRCTALDDFDLVFFDSGDTSSRSDKLLEEELGHRLPRVLRVSVSNQSRMHLENGELPRFSLADAVENWPETATSVAARLCENNSLEFLAPHGFGDLLNLIVRPTPYHSGNSASYIRRRQVKQWQAVWTELSFR
jgi:uncharacterized protein